MYTIGSIVSNTGNSMEIHGHQLYHGDQFIMNMNVQSLCCTPEINTILHANYTSI